ncbi:MAG: hypothetical protein AAGF74_10315 [Pseudomonadota bacterium]
MRKARSPLFLERESYRRRRLTDAARVLPIVAMVLFFIPVLWATPEDNASSTSRGGFYVFAIWAGLIVAVALLSRAISQPEKAVPPATKDPDQPDGDEGS